MKRKSGVLKLGLAALFGLTAVLSGCGSKETENGAAATPSVTPTTAASAAAQSGIENPRVAFVYIGPPGDGGYTYQHDQGRLYLEQELGIEATAIENVPESADAERVITELAQDHDIIFTTSFGYMDFTLNVAKKFPNVKFFHCSGYKTADNMSTYFGKNYQASYLSGIAAGKMTTNNVIGYVGAFPIPELIYNINAFTLGVQSVNEDAKVNVVWSNTWYDPTTEKQAAISLLDKGADVLIAYQDSPATLQAAAERGAYAGGNNSDMSRFAPDAYLTNPVWNWGPYYVKAVKAVIDGTYETEQFSGDMTDGTVTLAPFGNKVPDDVKQLVEEKQKAIIDGTFEVFSGPIVDQFGATKVADGATLTLEEILAMDWFVQGVEGTIPK